ncbi:hypothetical protein BXZ70DRAFT_1005881 [Cristinia sonorae]|uniref:Uncharacterized protein n=1 Tax=Cristinia sonorae TaxID=1940300 RepID=A0A8K0UVG4_9AGAR|nr:hypothetical protein BXZ70DRAFT_1005881 [Cristinia sonorae]
MILPDDTPPSPDKLQRELVDTARTTNPAVGPSPPPYPGYSSYQRGEPVLVNQASSSTSPYVPLPTHTVVDLNRARQRAVRRFMTALIWALVIYALFGILFGSVAELVSPHRRWLRLTRPKPPYQNPWPTLTDGKIHRCHSNQDPRKVNIAIPLELPASSDVLYLFSRGNFATGDVLFRQDPTLKNDAVMINVLMSHRTSESAGFVTVCSLERNDGERGIGFFTPDIWRDTHIPIVEFSIVVNLPVSTGSEPTYIKAFETNLPHFAHQMANLEEDVSFGSIDFQSSSAHINIGTLRSLKASMITTNGHIVGNFTTYDKLSLITSNGFISANVKSHNANEDSPTKVIMKTTNSGLTSNIDLFSDAENHAGGSFSVDARTSNGALVVDFPTSPSAAHLSLSARTSNAQAQVHLHPRYEGTFGLVTSPSTKTVLQHQDSTEDPDGEGRERIVDITTNMRGVLEGTITWGRKEDAKRLGNVLVRTSSSPVSLVL